MNKNVEQICYLLNKSSDLLDKICWTVNEFGEQFVEQRNKSEIFAGQFVEQISQFVEQITKSPIW